MPHVISRLGDLLKNYDMKNTRLEYLKSALENIKNDEHAHISLKLVLRILDIYPSQTSSLEDNSKALVLQTLQTENDLFSLVLTQFKEFKESVLANVA